MHPEDTQSMLEYTQSVLEYASASVLWTLVENRIFRLHSEDTQSVLTAYAKCTQRIS